MKNIVIFGATSAIAQETAKLFAAEGDKIFLVGRNKEALKIIEQDLKVWGASDVGISVADLNHFEKHPSLFQEAKQFLGTMDLVLIAHGTLGDQKACEGDYSKAELEMKTNFLSTVSLLTLFANFFEQEKSGCIVAISSVAGDRGRQSNYIYGAAKGALSIFLQGLRNRLAASNVSVITIKPGFVDTPMTTSFKKNFLFVKPDLIAHGIYKAILKKKEIVYLPWFWKVIMTIVCMIPEKIFKKLKLVLILILTCLSATTAEAKLSARDIVPCNDKNLLVRSSAKLMGEGSGLLSNLTDGKVYENGALWNLPQTVTLSHGSFLLFDLGMEHPISSAWMQGDNNDIYTVEGSRDGTTYSPIALFSPVDTMGLQTRSLINLKGKARYIKITPSEGDGWYSLSEVGLYCTTPSPFPPPPEILATQKETPWGNRINDYRVTVYKVFIVLAALLLFGFSYYLKRYGRTRYLITSRLLVLGIVALLGYASYYNFYHWHFENDIHTWEVYHYYLGSKYFPELGYIKLYECTSLADSEEGLLSQVQNRKIRDHRSNTIRPATYILENPNLCKEKFTPHRWEEFKTDLRWFRGTMTSDRWSSMQMDHGYNPPPVWTTLGRLVGSFYHATTDDIRSLVQMDILIVLIGFAFIGWAFGWEGLLLAVIVWGTNYPSRYYWIGGAFLRQSWLVASMIGLSFLKKQKPILGGIFLSLATALTIFPLMFVVGICLKIFQDWRSRKILTPFYRRFLAGTIISGTLFFSISLVGTGGGLSAYRDFTHVMQTHMNTPLTNNMGLKTVMNFRPSTIGEKMYDNRRFDPFEIWKNERRQSFQNIKPLYMIVVAGFFFLFWRAIRTAEPWEAAALGFTLIPMLNELTCYYYSFIIGGSLIGSKRPQLGLAMLLANLAWLMCEFYFGWFDVKYTYASLVGIVLCFYFVLEMGKTKNIKP